MPDVILSSTTFPVTSCPASLQPSQCGERLLSDNRYFFSRRELTELISRFLRDELNAPKHLNGDQVLEAIEVQQGLIVQRAQDAWSFSHLTLQEYLTAVWYENNQKLPQLVNEHLFDIRWREVFILVGGVSSKADDTLERMQRVAEKRLAGEPNVLQLIRWTNRAATSRDPEKASAQRALALAIAVALALDPAHSLSLTYILELIHDIARDLSLTRALTNLIGLVGGLGITRELKLDPNSVGGIDYSRDLDLVSNQLSSVLAQFDAFRPLSKACQETLQQASMMIKHSGGGASSEKPDQIWNRATHGIADILQFPPAARALAKNQHEWRVLVDYLYACDLLVVTKDAATRVSRSTWESLRQRILNPPEQSPSNTARKDRRRK